MFCSSSYQTIARYDDNSRRTRARDIDDIRFKQRESLSHSRHQSRSLRMLQCRRTLAMFLSSPESMAEHTPNGYDECDSQCSQNSNPTNDPWGIGQDTTSNWGSSRFAPSPSPSVSSTSSQVSQDSSSDFHVPKFFLEVQTKSSRNHRRPSKSNSNNTTRSKYYKQQSQSLSPSNTGFSKCRLDEDKVKSDLEGLKQILNRTQDRLQLTKLVNQHFFIILNATKATTRETGLASLNLLHSLAFANLLDQETILNLIRGGLMFNLSALLSGFGDEEFDLVLDFFSDVIRHNPSLLPYLVDTMNSSSVLDDFRSGVAYKSSDQVIKVVRFYLQISNALIIQLIQPTPLVLPDILRQTGVTKEIIASYSPTSTYIKCFNQDLISELISKILVDTNSQGAELIQTILVILANTIRVAQTEAIDRKWQSDLQSSIDNNCLSERLELLMCSLNQENQQKQFDSQQTYDSRRFLIETCTQFSEFFQQYRFRSSSQ